MSRKKESKSHGELHRKHWFCIRGNISAGPHAPSTPGPLIRHKVYSSWGNSWGTEILMGKPMRNENSSRKSSWGILYSWVTHEEKIPHDFFFVRVGACKNAKFALQHPIIFGVLASPWTTLKTEKRKLACSWGMKSVSGHLKWPECMYLVGHRSLGWWLLLSFWGWHQHHRRCVTLEKNAFPFVLGTVADSPGSSSRSHLRLPCLDDRRSIPVKVRWYDFCCWLRMQPTINTTLSPKAHRCLKLAQGRRPEAPHSLPLAGFSPTQTRMNACQLQVFHMIFWIQCTTHAARSRPRSFTCSWPALLVIVSVQIWRKKKKRQVSLTAISALIFEGNFSILVAQFISEQGRQSARPGRKNGCDCRSVQSLSDQASLNLCIMPGGLRGLPSRFFFFACNQDMFVRVCALLAEVCTGLFYMNRMCG